MARTVVFEIAENGTYYVIEAVPDTAKKTNLIVSAYMLKKGAKKQPPHPSLVKKARALRPNTQGGWLLVALYHRRLRMSIPVTNKHRPRRLKQQQSNLPKGTGAAELGFTGEMTAADQWVAEAQGQGDDALHPISEESQRNNLAEQAPVRWAVDFCGDKRGRTAELLRDAAKAACGEN